MRLLKDERGLEVVEWVVMGCVIILGTIALVHVLLTDLGSGVDAISDEIQTATELGTGS